MSFSCYLYYFGYFYETENESDAVVRFALEEYWINFEDLPIVADEKTSDIIEFSDDDIASKPALREKLNRYATLFYQKIEAYFKKTNNIMLGNNIASKVIRMSADNLNQREQIVLNRSALLSCELDDLFK